MTKYIGPKTDGANVATQSDVGGSSLSDATPDALTPDQAGAAGTVNLAARADHAHEILCAAAGAILPDDVAAEGTASSFARSDHTHAIAAAAPSANLTASTTNSEGTASSFARSDHSHAITTAAPGTISPDDAAAAGTSASLARADHTHAITAASAGTISYATAEGTATSFARSDHNHQIQAVGAFSAYLNVNQNITSGAIVDVAFDTEDFDISGWHDASTNKGRYTPQKAGYYLLGCFVSMSTLSGPGKYYQVFIGVNGANHRELLLFQHEGFPNFPRGSASAIVYANGTTDYFTIRVFSSSVDTETIQSGDKPRFWGHYLGSA